MPSSPSAPRVALGAQSATARLDALRGPVPPRSHDARTIAALTVNPGCSRRAVLDAAGVDKRKLAEQRRTDPGDDLVSALVHVNDAQDGRLSDVELLANVVLLFVAGFETTTNLLGNGLCLGFENPEVLARVRSGEIPVSDYVEEVLRYDSPVQLTTRFALAEGARVGELQIEVGDQILMLMGAAHRDPARFPNPDVFDPTRPDNVPLSFGAGIHYCLGQGLARLEAQVAFRKLFARFPQLGLAAPPTRQDRLVLRGYQSLPVSLGSAAAA